MKIYILRPIISGGEPWSPWYDKAFGFVVCAETSEEARHLAQEAGGDEVWENFHSTKNSVWTNPSLTICKELVAGDEAKIIMRDFAAA